MIVSLLLSLVTPAPGASTLPRSAGPAVTAPFAGRFHVAYQPIRCVRAPCPPGRHRIAMPGRPAVMAQVVVYDPATPVAMRVPLRGQGPAEGTGIDGQVRFVREADGRAIRAIILARRAVAGRWKP